MSVDAARRYHSFMAISLQTLVRFRSSFFLAPHGIPTRSLAGWFKLRSLPLSSSRSGSVKLSAVRPGTAEGICYKNDTTHLPSRYPSPSPMTISFEPLVHFRTSFFGSASPHA
jgi:hypothetical protein